LTFTAIPKVGNEFVPEPAILLNDLKKVIVVLREILHDD
jgi:hypothetical protein